MKTYYLINGEWIEIATDPRYIAYGNGVFTLHEKQNRNLLQIIYPVYTECGYFSEGRAIVKDINNLYGYMNKNGSLICPCIYQKLAPFHNGVAIVYDGHYHVIDYNGKLIIKDNFASIEYCGYDDKYLQCNDKYGDSKLYKIKDLIGEFSYPQEEMTIKIADYQLQTGESGRITTTFYGDYAAFNLYNKWGIIDQNANVIEPFIHKEKITPHDNMLIFIENNILYIIDLKKQEIKEYDSRLYEQAYNYFKKQDAYPRVHVIDVINNCEVKVESIISVNQNIISKEIHNIKQKKKRKENDNSSNEN